MRPLSFGVVTPTYRRPRLVRRLYSRLLGQQLGQWRWAIIHDGPDRTLQTENLTREDSRIIFLNTSKKNDDYGASGRLCGARYFLAQANPPDYLVFWDDDDWFGPKALGLIEAQLRLHAFPDLLLVPFTVGGRILPPDGRSPALLEKGELTTANLVMRPNLAAVVYERVVEQKIWRATDFYAFAAARSITGTKIGLAEGCPSIGFADGLRRLPHVLKFFGLPTWLGWWFHLHRIRAAVRRIGLEKA